VSQRHIILWREVRGTRLNGGWAERSEADDFSGEEAVEQQKAKRL